MESPRRYILDKTVRGFIYVLFISYLYPIYVLKDMVDKLKVKGFTSVLEGVYRKLVLL